MWLVILLIAAVIVFSLYYGNKKTSNLLEGGKIIKRNGAYWEEGQEYILVLENPNLVTQKVEVFPYSEMKVNMKGDKEKQVFNFSSYNFDAQLRYKETAAEKSVYCFEFIRWKNNQLGTPIGIFEMNMLMTAIEKMFLSIDSNTQVTSKRLDIKTKHSFF